MAYQHILIATGGADHSLRAEALAIELAAVLRAKLTVLSVLRMTGTMQGMVAGVPLETGAMSARFFDEMKAHHQSILSKAEERCEEASVGAETVLESGSPGRVIIEVAEARNCGLIVLGTRQLSAIGAFALGSVSDYVNHQAHCDVLIVR